MEAFSPERPATAPITPGISEDAGRVVVVWEATPFNEEDDIFARAQNLSAASCMGYHSLQYTPVAQQFASCWLHGNGECSE